MKKKDRAKIAAEIKDQTQTDAEAIDRGREKPGVEIPFDR